MPEHRQAIENLALDDPVGTVINQQAGALLAAEVVPSEESALVGCAIDAVALPSCTFD